MASDNSMPAKMKAVQLVEYNQPYQLKTVDVPHPGPRDLLVKIATSSYCHTDSIIGAGGIPGKLPRTFSHEGAGTVVAVGSEVQGRYKVGDRVACGVPAHPCGACEECTRPDASLRQYCAKVEGHSGVHIDGYMAEYAVTDERFATKLPDKMSFLSAAPLACAGRTVWRGLNLTELEKGKTVAIVGSGGGLGHLGVQFAKAKGLSVIGIDAKDEGLNLSRHYCADLVLDAREGIEAVTAKVMDFTSGAGADSTLILSDAPDATGLGCHITRMHASLIQIALPRTVSLPLDPFMFRDIRVRSSLIASPGESEEMMDFVVEHGIEVRREVFGGLDEDGEGGVWEMLERVRGGKVEGKAVCVVDAEQVEEEEKKKMGAK